MSVLSKSWSPMSEELPSTQEILADREQVTQQRSWYVNSLGMTMIRVPDLYGEPFGISVADREVSVAEFQAFVSGCLL